jgi:hypothetical protein
MVLKLAMAHIGNDGRLTHAREVAKSDRHDILNIIYEN